MLRTVHALCVAGLAFAAMALPAAAETGRSTPGIQVYYGDLDTTSQAGAKVLVGRIKAAARTVCDGDSQPLGLAQLRQRKCEADAVSRAVARLNNPVVSQMIAESTEKHMIFASR